MAESSSSHGPLYSLYEQYVGEPHSVTDVYGYWVFVLGYLIAITGIVAFLVEMSTGAFTQLLLREAAYVLTALALPLALFGIVLILPVQRWGLYAAGGGLAIAVPGVAWFATVYPEGWGADEANIAIIAVYSAGVAIIAGVTILIPVITGKRSALAEIIEKATSDPEPAPEPEPQVVEPEIEPGEEQSPVMLGQTRRGALFAVFHTGTEWSWRLIEEEAIADTPSQYRSPQATEEGAERVKSLIDSAGMLETADAAFRLYQTDEDSWGWVLMRENGEIVAEGEDDFASRDAVEESVNLLKEYGPEATPVTFEGATIDYDRHGGRWRWRLLDESRDELAVSPDTYADKTDAVRSASAMRNAADGGQILTLDDYGVELYREQAAARAPEQPTEADGGIEQAWRWRLIDADDTVIATGSGGHDSRGTVETAAHDLLDRIGNAAMMEAGKPVYKISPDSAGGWRWRLIGAGTSAVARSHGTDSRANVERTAKTMRANVSDADVFVVDGTSFEVYDDDGWRWRLVDENRTPIAVGDHSYPDRESATEAVQTVCDQVPDAELIEFDTAAFQIYEAGEQSTHQSEETVTEWRWRLIDEDGDVLADSGDDYGTRSQALESMNTLKQYAPDAELLEVDTVAFELYDDDDVWYWRLIDENGDLLARSGEGYPSRGDARESMDRLIGSAPETETRVMDSAGFQVYDADDAWHWRFLMPDGRVLADSTDEHATRDQAFAAIDDLRPDAASAGLATVEDLVIRIIQSEEGWRWQIVDEDDTLIADGARTYEERDHLEAELGEIRRCADDIIVFEMDEPVFRVRNDDGWRWQLIDGDRSEFARSADARHSEGAARESIDRVRRLAPDAESTDYDPAAFELVEAEDGWHWQLVDEDREVIATGTETYDDREETRDGIDAVKSVLGDANIFEFDHAMFELRESDEGWRWHLTDANGDLVGRSLDSYPTRSEARQAMRTVKDIGPDARIAVTGAAD